MATETILRGLLRTGAAVATAAGVHTALAGGRAVPGWDTPADPRLESELRFFGPFYAAYGVALWRADPADARAVREAAATLFAAGVARAAGWHSQGRPSRRQLALLSIELIVPPAIVALQERAG